MSVEAKSSSLISPDKMRMRWLMLGLCWLLYFSFGLTFGTIAPLVTPIQNDLDMTSSQMGLIHGSWHVVYIFIAPLMGVLVDRFGVRKSLGLGVSIILLSLVTRGLAVNFVTLLITVGAFGFGGPIISVGAPKLVSVWFSGRERGIATGIYATGPAAGIALALATANSVVVPLTGSWRGISLVYGVLVGLIVVAWLVLAREPASSPQPDTGSAMVRGGASRTAFTSLLRLRNVRLIMILAMGSFVLHVGNSSWAPALLEEKGMTLSQGGLWMAVATALGTIGLLVIPGFVKHGYRVHATTTLLIFGAITALGLTFLNGAPLIASLVLLTCCSQPLLPMSLLLLMETPGVGAARMGVAAGLYFSSAEVGGFFGPFVMGVLRDASDSLEPGFLLVAAAAAVLVPVVPFLKEVRDKQTSPTTSPTIAKHQAK